MHCSWKIGLQTGCVGMISGFGLVAIGMQAFKHGVFIHRVGSRLPAEESPRPVFVGDFWAPFEGSQGAPINWAEWYDWRF